MLIIALVFAVIGLAALVFAVVTSNVLVAWVCIGASVLGVVLLIIDALRERRRPLPITTMATSRPLTNPNRPHRTAARRLRIRSRLPMPLTRMKLQNLLKPQKPIASAATTTTPASHPSTAIGRAVPEPRRR
jgi:hypothetical protein